MSPANQTDQAMIDFERAMVLFLLSDFRYAGFCVKKLQMDTFP